MRMERDGSAWVRRPAMIHAAVPPMKTSVSGYNIELLKKGGVTACNNDVIFLSIFVGRHIEVFGSVGTVIFKKSFHSLRVRWRW